MHDLPPAQILTPAAAAPAATEPAPSPPPETASTEPSPSAEVLPAMIDVHPPHTAAHTWRDFFIHIATITVGLLIAVGLEQTVEAVHRHHEADKLREELREESEQILGDSRRTVDAHLYEIAWLKHRIGQVQAAIWEHQALPPENPNNKPYSTSPDIPIWRAAKASALTPLLSKGEVNAFSEIEYVQTRVDQMAARANRALGDVEVFVSRFPPKPDGKPDLTKASAEDLQTYLTLLTSARQSNEQYVFWLRILIGADLAVRDGKTRLEDIYASEHASAEQGRTDARKP